MGLALILNTIEKDAVIQTTVDRTGREKRKPIISRSNNVRASVESVDTTNEIMAINNESCKLVN